MPASSEPISARSATTVARIPMPTMVNRSSVTACIKMSTRTVAPASPPAMPKNVITRTPAISPPICATGNSALIASRMKRTQTQA
jgi:hypothetical protein